MEVVFLTGLVALAVFNIYASRQCYRDAFSSPRQRWFQIVFIWLVPFMGAVLALKILRGEPGKSSGKYRVDIETENEFSTSGRLNSDGYISTRNDSTDSIGGDS